jgi:chromosome segregation ATPase
VTTELKRLKIDRVDLVPEGANSAAFVTLYKGKEMKPMTLDELLAKAKPENAKIIQDSLDEVNKAKAEVEEELNKTKAELEEANAALAKAAEDADEADEAEKACTKKSSDEDDEGGSASFDETETLSKALEGLDPMIKEYVERISKQKAAAEQVAAEAIAKEKHANAVTKAEELKSLPIEKSKLVEFIEKSDTETVDLLQAIAAGINATVLSEVGKSANTTPFTAGGDSWSAIEKSAAEIAKERGISKEAAVGVAISEKPELYAAYLEGGAN